MKHPLLLRVWIMCCLLFGASGQATLSAQTLTLTGPDTACVGQSSTYTLVPPGSSPYSWGVSGGTFSGSTSGPSATIIWNTAGSQSVVAIANGSPAFKTVYVLPAPTLSIASNFEVGCQNLSMDSTKKPNHEGGGNTQDMENDGNCVKVCENSVVRYYALGATGSTFSWTVVGATLLNNWGDSIEVKWGVAGSSGSIAVTATGPCGAFTKSICIQVIEKPKASFSILPSLVPPSGVTVVCLGTPVIFKDLSVGSPASPLVSWYWMFGDGTTSSVQNPTHAYTTSGTYEVTLVVKNQCNCRDTFRAKIKVDPLSGPPIICPSVVCEKDTVWYSTTVTCPQYQWVVNGGTIISGGSLADNKVLVRWDAIGPGGFGYVSLTTPGCGAACPGTTTIKVPVVQQNAQITGPAVICVNEQYEYSFPLWPATQYHWGVIGFPSAIVGQREDYKVVVKFTTPGTYTLHGWYQNRIKLCGGDVKKTIIVQAPQQVLGDTLLCKGATKVYSLSGGSSASWTLQTPSGTVSGSGTTFTHTFILPGTYTLTPTGSFCAYPLTIRVQDLPPAVDSISGEDTVCLNRPYTYIAGADVAGTVYNWTAVGGVVAPGSGKEVVVVWTSTGAKQLIVNRANVMEPFCPGPQFVMNITHDFPTANITGDVVPCSNGPRVYNANYTRGETYEWSIAPSTLGSVTSYTATGTANVLWNSVPVATPGWVIVKVSKCDTSFTDSLAVTVQPAPNVAVSASSTLVCPGTAVVFTATPGAASYYWTFGDGTSVTTVSNVSPAHPYPQNTTSGNMSYTVSVTVSGTNGMSLCPPIGSTTIVVNVKAAPVAYASSPGPLIYCVGSPINTPLVGTITNNVPITSYLWSGGSFIGPNNTVNATAGSTGSYTLTVTGNGCSATSNPINISTVTCGGGGGCTGNPVTLTTSVNCNQITLTGGGGGTLPQWGFAVPPIGGAPSGTSGTVSYNMPGVYSITYSEYFSGTNCRSFITKTATIGLVAKYYYTLTCGTGTMNNVNLSDASVYLSGWTITNISWADGGGTFGTGANITKAYPAGSTQTITETVSGTGPSGPFSCTFTRTVVIPPKPVASFTAMPTALCEGVPFSFSAVPGSYINTTWDFGDLSGNVLFPNTQRTYTYTGPVPPGNPQNRTVTLTVTDSLGCTAIATQNIQVIRNNLNGNLGPDVTVCNGTPVVLTYSSISGSPTSYAWSTGVTNTTGTITVFQTGSYWVTVKDAMQCQKTLPVPAKDVKVLKTPAAVIYGSLKYCIGDVVSLSGYAGNGVTYQWKRNGSVIGTTPAIKDPGLGIGSYTYELTVTSTDPSSGVVCTSVATSVVNIYGLPTAPSISGPSVINCASYELKLTASHPNPGSFTWSNGTYGSTNNITVGGPYRVWYTDQNGCRSFADKFVPYAPETYFPYFPTGCYKLCNTQLPVTLYGPPGIGFAFWAWLKNGGIDLSGTGYVSPYNITGPGTYQQTLDNGLCSQTTDKMDVQVIPCDCQRMLRSAQVSCSSNPGGYTVVITFQTIAPNISYTLGTSIGPLVPFSGTFPTVGSYTLTLSFTTLMLPPPTSMEIQVAYTLPGGRKCFDKMIVDLPPCNWTPQRQANPNAAVAEEDATGMLVFPNPAGNTVAVEYEFGKETHKDRAIQVFDITGRRVTRQVVSDRHGVWKLQTGEWVPGTYIVRMEADGKAVQTQRLVIAR